jgi:hypothetical protein
VNQKRASEQFIEKYKSKAEGIIILRELPIKETKDIPVEEMDRDSLLALIGYMRYQSWQQQDWNNSEFIYSISE